ncbi:MAG: hypothetical protein KKB50_09195 [Planctomycetes bacterium]|nr:hypothetical protein [Planctomycetota bacterium]
MLQHSVKRLVGMCLAAGIVTPAWAAGHRDWTTIPLGSFRLEAGTQSIRVTRPYDRFGIIPSPIVFVALFEPDSVGRAPIEIRFTGGQSEYPTWTLRQPGQTYILGTAALERDAVEDKRVLELTVHVQPGAPGLALMASGAPDMKLAGSAALGPLGDVVGRVKPSAAREYLEATAVASTVSLTTAQGAFRRLSSSSDQQVARFARAAWRRIRFAEAEARLTSNFATHYRMGLYAQQCGLFRAARLHFEVALQTLRNAERPPPAWRVGDAWYRLGEMMERCGEPIEDVAQVMERAGQAARVSPNTWDALVAVLLSKEYEQEQDGKKTRVRVEMTPPQLDKIQREWRWVQQMVYGASGGQLLLNTRFQQIPHENALPYGLNVGWLYGPLDELVPVRGSVDCVMSFHPRGPSVTGGADCGPNGAAMTDIGTWCGWEVYLHEWSHQFDWTVRTSEAGDGYPITHHSDSCGHQPIPSMGYGHRASLRYYVTPAMYRRLEPADVDNGVGYIQSWLVGRPGAVADNVPPAGLPPHHVARPTPPVFDLATREFIVAATPEFIDLKQTFADLAWQMPAWCVTPATTYLWSPQRQEVRLWLGHNDGLALWINEQLIHRGDYFAIAKFEDQNWPSMLATAATLQRGWNRIDVAVEAWPAPRDGGYGFSVRVCGFDNQPIPGLQAVRRSDRLPPTIAPDPSLPHPGQHYDWDEVRDDFYNKLPRLDAGWLRDYADWPADLEVQAGIGATAGYVAWQAPRDATPGQQAGVPLRAAPTEGWHSPGFATRLDNVLDWNRESVAVYPIQRRGTWRHLLVMRAEAIEAFLTCLREAPQADELFGPGSARQRVLGYLQVGRMDGEKEGIRVLIVAEVLLLTPLPADEEDLLVPLPP